jgi:signal transduction histidine kinase/ActR/RegA family two-component response regulator
MIRLFSPELWKLALDKYAEVTELSVELFGVEGPVVRDLGYSPPLVALFREYGYEPGLYAECARRCLSQTHSRPAVVVDGPHGLIVVGTSLALEGAIVGVAVAGYALAGFSNVTAVQHWADSARIPFDRLWSTVRRLPPVPARRLLLQGELLQVLGDALLRENHRTRQYEETVQQLTTASAAKDDFLATLSHELRTPLAPIAGWASMLRKGNSLEHVQRAAASIERNALLQSRMIDDLLDVSRITHGSIKLELEVLELPPCVRAAVETFAQDLEKKAIRVDFVDAGEPLIVEGDAGRLQQIFRNIFSNAVRFTPAGGSIRVSLGREADNALVVVADTGKGITPEFLPFVFDRFRQEDQSPRREYDGLGIGLALVKKFTELHKGAVNVESAGYGRGAKVTVRLPLAAGARDAPAAAIAEQRETSSLAGLSVLVVDDVPDVRETLQVLLQHLGAEVSVAGSGREALDMMQDVEPDLVLCDLRMPRMDGFEFIHELQRADPSGHPPVVAISAHASDADRQRSRDAGFDAYLKKPFDEASVVAALGTAVSRRQYRRPPASQM